LFFLFFPTQQQTTPMLFKIALIAVLFLLFFYSSLTTASVVPNGTVAAVYLGYQDLSHSYGTIGDTIVQAVKDGYNIINLAFWIDPVTGADPYSAASLWQNLADNQKADTLNYIHLHNATLLLSVGGSSFMAYALDGPNSGLNYGEAAAQYAMLMRYDGIDFDMENFISPGFTTASGLTKAQTIQWLTRVTCMARMIMGASAVITHAPQSPYFQAEEFANGYLDFYFQTPTPSVNYFFIQYYNQGATYLTFNDQMIQNSWHPGTAILELMNRGLPKQLLVLGKLTQKSDGSADSWVSPSKIGSWLPEAKTEFGWDTGVSTWQWNSKGNPTSKEWINQVFLTESF
jgi:hypothetical protein